MSRGTFLGIFSYTKLCKNNDKLNVQNVVIDIKELNNLNSSVIYDGQKLLVYEY